MAEEKIALSKEEIDNIIKGYTTLLANVLSMELDNILDRFGMDSVPAEMFPYLAALATMGFCARDSDDSMLENLLKAVDIEPDPEITQRISSLRIHNYIIYVHILYFLLDVGRKPTVDGMLRVAKALGFAPDVTLANRILKIYGQGQA